MMSREQALQPLSYVIIVLLNSFSETGLLVVCGYLGARTHNQTMVSAPIGLDALELEPQSLEVFPRFDPDL
jgi:hypothetical protein